MTKSKLDACEQRWVAKLAPNTFDLRHIPGAKNIVADALSRDPFSRTVSLRLISEPYESLLAEAEGTKEDGIQDAFRSKVKFLRADGASCATVDASQVKSICEAHVEWERAAESRVVQFINSFPQILPRRFPSFLIQ